MNKLLRKYAEKMSASERIFLYIFSLFRTEVTENDFAGVFRHEIEDTKFNEVLIKMNELDFKDLVIGLVDWRLVSYDETKKTYTTHPLIKGYFESDFAETNEKLCHKRIYQYFGEYVCTRAARNIRGDAALFEQVYHGCAAGLYDEGFYDVYWEKIQRRAEGHFIAHKLGAWETDLSLVKIFFPKGDLSQMPLVSNNSTKSWLINEAGLALLSTGKPKEAEEPFLTSVQMAIEDGAGENASAGYRNLVELQSRIGEIAKGLSSARKALDAAEIAKSDGDVIESKPYLAWIFHLLGKSEEAGKELRQADELEGKISGHRLYSVYGIFYADFLLSMKRIDGAFELTKQNLEISQRNNWTNDISRCHRCLGAIERLKGNHKAAEIHLQNALEIARKVGMPSLEIEALLEFGRLHLDMGRHEDAVGSCKAVLKLCERTGFKLYEPEAKVILGKAYLALNKIEEAKTAAQSAYEKATEMKYRWPEGDASHLLGEVYLAMNEKEKAREWLEKAVACRKEIQDPEVKESEMLLKRL